jgi:hypothetical protein
LIDQKVVDALREFCEMTHLMRKTLGAGLDFTGSFPFSFPFTFTSSGSGEYNYITINFALYSNMTGYEPIVPVLLKIDGAQYSPINYTIDHGATEIADEINYLLQSDTVFYQFPTITTMDLFPFSDDYSDAELLLTLVVKPTDAVTSVDDIFYNQYRDAICAIATAHLQRMKGRPWSDLEQAIINQGLAERKISEALALFRITQYEIKPRKNGYI